MTDAGNAVSGPGQPEQAVQPERYGELQPATAGTLAESAAASDQAPGRRGVTRTLASAARRSAALTGRGARRGAAVTARGARRGAAVTGRGARWSTARLADQVLAAAPRLPVRDQATLRAQYPDRTPEVLAEALIDSAARMSATTGAAVGTWAALPFMPGFAVQVATETVTVISIEVKLIAELHEIYGMRAAGPVVDRMTAYVGSWATRRGVALGPAGVVIALGSPLRLRLQRRIAARIGQSTASLGPLLTGAAAGALINRHETRRLGRDVASDLSKRSPNASRWTS